MKAKHNTTKKSRKPTPLTQEQINIMVSMLVLAKIYIAKGRITHVCNALKIVMMEISRQQEATPEALKMCRKANKYLLKWVQSMLGEHETLECWLQARYMFQSYETLYARDDRLTRTRAEWVNWMLNELINQGE